MGAAHSSTPPPLIQVSAPYGKVLVPPGTGFQVYPPPGPRRGGGGGGGGLAYSWRGREYLDDEEGSEIGVGVGVGVGMGRPRSASGGLGRGMVGGLGEFGLGSGGVGMGMGCGGGGGGMGYGGVGPGGMGPGGMGPGGMGPGGMGPGGMGPGGMGPGGMGPGGMGPGGMGPGGMGPGGMGPRGIMRGPPGMMPNGMFPPQDLPPRYSNASMHPPPAGPQNPYNAYPPSPSSTSSAPANPPDRPSHRTPANKHVPMGAYAKTSAPSPKIPRARTSPSTAERVHRTTPAGGKEWIKGDDFLDACLCTTNCTCRAGHRVLYRSRDDGGGSGSDTDGRCNMGEIRYVLKKDVGRDCGDHSGCGKRDGSSSSSSASASSKNSTSGKKSKQKAEKKRKDELRGFKEDLLDALDERFDKFKRERAMSKASGSVKSTPRPAFAAPFGTQIPVHGAGMDPLVAQKLGMGMPMMGGAAGNPYAGLGAVPPLGMMNKGPPGISNAGGMHPMRPPGPMQMPVGGMPFGDDMSMADMDGMGMGDGYFAGNRRGKAMQSRFMSPGRRGSRGMDVDAMAYYSGRPGFGGRGGRGRSHAQRPGRFTGNDDFDLDIGPSRRPGLGKPNHDGRQDSFDNTAGAHMDDDNDSRPQGIGSPRGNTGKKGRGRGPGRHQARIESTDDDGSYKG